MPLVAVAMLPHGSALIPALSSASDELHDLRHAARAVGDRFREQGVESIVLVGPHGIRVDGAMAIVHTGRAAGTLREGSSSIEMNLPVDRDLGDEICEDAVRHGIPAVTCGFGGNSEKGSVAPLDWGAMVPLWYTGHDQDRTGFGDVLSPVPDGPDGPPVVLIVPSRKLSRSAQISFGRSLASTFQSSAKRIGFIASCDWSHTHSAAGPYGAHPSARLVDDTVQNAIRNNDLASLEFLPAPDVEAAAIDGLWQTLILAGIQSVIPMHCDNMSYGICEYFSMIVANYRLDASR